MKKSSEAARPKGREGGTQQNKRTARADGVVTRDERQDTRKNESPASRATCHHKHDGQERPRVVR